MTHMPRIAPPEPDENVDRLAQQRMAIDLFATTRAKTIRAALFATYLFRHHPTRPEDEATRESWRTVLQELYEDLARTCQLLGGRDPMGVVQNDICRWIAEHSALHPDAVRAFERTRDLTYDMVTAAQANDSEALEKALEAHKSYGRGGFFETVTSFCDRLWRGLDDDRHSEVERASAVAGAITKTLQRLEHIGKHVRLVSLNASVEAARVGDAGRGLGVIAVEFKTLAEEIQHLATTARADISALGLSSDNTAKHTRSDL